MGVAVQTVDDLKNVLQSVAQVSGKVFHVLSEEEVVALAGQVPSPAIGIVYEGIRANAEDKPTHRMGASGKVSVGRVLFFKTAPSLGKDQREEYNRQALEIFDRIRKKMLDTKGSNGRFWEFVAEAPAFEKSGAVMWVQRWALPSILL